MRKIDHPKRWEAQLAEYRRLLTQQIVEDCETARQWQAYYERQERINRLYKLVY